MPEPLLTVGGLVRWTATDETGRLRNLFDGLAEVDFPTGTRLLELSELEPVSEDPLDDLLQGQIGRAEPYGLRLQALYLKHAYRFDPCAGLSNARIEPALHQIYVAHRVVSKLRPRMILADEVGLGKTIEAGLVIKELRARGLIDRVIIVTPASLTIQWQQELRSKFNEDFEIIDKTAVRYLGKDGNPWAKRNNVICSLEFARREDNFDSIVSAGWDLVVFDEAHRVRRNRVGNQLKRTRAYELADELKELTNGFLLLTATPMQLHNYELYSLIELVEPGLYTYEEYSSMSKTIPKLNELLKNLSEWETLGPLEKGQTKRSPYLIGYEDLENEDDRERAEKAILKRHPLAEVLVRNRKAVLGGFSGREPITHMVELTDEEEDLYEEVSRYIKRGYNRAQRERNLAIGFVMVTYQKLLASSSHALRVSMRKRIDNLKQQISELEQTDTKANRSNRGWGNSYNPDELYENFQDDGYDIDLKTAWTDPRNIRAEIRELEDLVDRLGNTRDSKAKTLLRIVEKIDSNYKIVIFTQFVQTQKFLQETLQRNGYEVAIFNGGMDINQKERSIQRFRQKSQILIATEAGGEGRNLQFANIMVNYDLPWNPMKIEQRIGRLDRIGQKSTVYIYNLACTGTIEERILRVLNERIGLFKESVGSLDPILGDIEKDLRRLILSSEGDTDKAFSEFSEQLGNDVTKARKAERLLGTFALDRASFRKDHASAMLDTQRLATPHDLRQHITDSLNYFGGRMNDHDKRGQVFLFSPKLISRLRTRSSTHRGIFDPLDALENEDLDFFAFGHPLIDKIIDLPLNRKPVPWTSARIISGIPSGIHLEVFYELTTQGHPPYGIILRHLVNEKGIVERSQVTSIPEIGRDTVSLGIPAWLSSAATTSRKDIQQRYVAEYKEATRQNEEWKRQELARAKRIFDYSKVRLEELIQRQREWIVEVEREGTKGQRRVLAARKGKLKKDKARLERLRSEYETQQTEINSKHHGLASNMLAAGLVIGG